MLKSVATDILTLKAQGLKILGYARVSKSQREHEKSLRNMRLDLEEAGCDLVLTEMVSGYQNKIRREYDKARKLIASREYQAFVIPRIDRIGRRFIQSVEFEEEIRELGCHFFVLDYGRVDVASAQGWKDFNQACLDAEFEARKTSSRVSRGKRARRRAGQPNNGKPIFGYRNNPDLTALEIDEATYGDARKRVELFIECQGNVRLWCRELEKATGKPNPRRSLAKWIVSPTLRGHITYSNPPEILRDRHPALITPAEDLQIQKLIESRKSARGRHGHRPAHPLQGLVYCGHCKAKLYRKRTVSRGNVYHYLTHDSACDHRQNASYESIIDEVNERISLRAAEIIKEVYAPEDRPKPKELIEKERQLNELILARRNTGLKTLDPLIQELEGEIESISLSLSGHTDAEMDLRDQVAALENLDLWRTFTDEELRSIYVDIVAGVRLEDGVLIEVDFTF